MKKRITTVSLLIMAVIISVITVHTTLAEEEQLFARTRVKIPNNLPWYPIVVLAIIDLVIQPALSYRLYLRKS